LKAEAEADVAQELEQHLEDTYRALLSAGASEEEAYRKTLAELDDTHPLHTAFKRSDYMPTTSDNPGNFLPGNFLEDFWRDVRYAFRTMGKSPLFVLFVVLTLALGIGANTTVFTVINTLLLNPLPVPNSSELASISLASAPNASKASAPSPLSYADLKDYQSRNEVFQSLAGYTSPRPLTWQANGASQGIFGELVTANYFSALDLRPSKGRFFSREEEDKPGAHPVAVMNCGTWQSRFGGAPDIIGKTLRLNSVVFTVIGVAPPR